MNKFLGGLATAALVAAASSAVAVPYTYTMTFDGNASKQATGGTTVSGVGQVGGTINESDTTSTPSGGGTLNAHISAYSKSGTGSNAGTVSKAYLGNYATGLGVTNVQTPVESGSPAHTVDNRDNTDFVVFQFDQKISLTEIVLDLFADGGQTDSDVSIGWANTTYSSTAGNVPFNNGATFTSLGINMLSTFTGGSSPDPRTVTFGAATANIYANTWIIMADMLRSGTDYDDFKITSIKLTTKDNAVPEPATWAMMISGFGFIGASLRRRGRKTAMAA